MPVIWHKDFPIHKDVVIQTIQKLKISQTDVHLRFYDRYRVEYGMSAEKIKSH